MKTDSGIILTPWSDLAAFPGNLVRGAVRNQADAYRAALGVYSYRVLSQVYRSDKEERAFETLKVGEEYFLDVPITESLIGLFGLVTDDWNPVHFDSKFAATTRFRVPISHGVLLLGIISRLLGNELPGPGTALVRNEIDYKRPVPIGDLITVLVRIVELNPDGQRIKLWTEARKQTGKTAAEGFAYCCLFPPESAEVIQ